MADGASERDHLVSVWRQTGVEPEGLDGLVPPRGAEALVEVFRELNARRSSNGFGPNPISHRDIQAFCDLTGVALTPWQVHTLMAMDNAALAEMARAHKSESGDR